MPRLLFKKNYHYRAAMDFFASDESCLYNKAMQKQLHTENTYEKKLLKNEMEQFFR